MQRIGVARALAEHRVGAEAAGDEVVGHAVVSRMRTEAQPAKMGSASCAQRLRLEWFFRRTARATRQAAAASTSVHP